MSYNFPEGSRFLFSNTFAAAKTLSAMTNANPCVATSTTHGYVDNDARVLDYGRVYGHAYVTGRARVSDTACVMGRARVSGDARIGGSARISGSVRVQGNRVG